MTASLAFVHALNFVLPALLLGALSAALAKLAWRRALARVRWWRLAVWAGVAALMALIGGLLLAGHDGAMATYAAMVLAAAAALAWVGWGARR